MDFSHERKKGVHVINEDNCLIVSFETKEHEEYYDDTNIPEIVTEVVIVEDYFLNGSYVSINELISQFGKDVAYYAIDSAITNLY